MRKKIDEKCTRKIFIELCAHFSLHIFTNAKIQNIKYEE